MSPKRKPKSNPPHPIGSALIRIGYWVTLAGIVLMACILLPVAFQELQYHFVTSITPQTQRLENKQMIQPVDANFGIVIPKINANAKVIPNVDPYNSTEYQQALTKGVAHAKGSAFPGHVGNVFIFSHSSVNFFDALRYNSVFYLLHKLEKGDQILLYFNHQQFTYIVSDKTLISPSAITYLTAKTDKKLLTLMTCWPPGTTFQRLIIRAILREP